MTSSELTTLSETDERDLFYVDFDFWSALVES